MHACCTATRCDVPCLQTPSLLLLDASHCSQALREAALNPNRRQCLQCQVAIATSTLAGLQRPAAALAPGSSSSGAARATTQSGATALALCAPCSSTVAAWGSLVQRLARDMTWQDAARVMRHLTMMILQVSVSQLVTLWVPQLVPALAACTIM
eukprot:TRINITY_DN4218_c0_g3_i3.p1 TRINITY_DN4218_c0_g3~~TRINITY_DN4218_c0_g3_i3.p1  ORF type:complete len:154 (-),score=23.28 TRINITY_DN4218_c0_g3_i3:369-830(-)